jgi:hypothetical protein
MRQGPTTMPPSAVKGAGTTFSDADGVRMVVGTPIHPIGPDGGTRLIDAGLVTFGNELDVRAHTRVWLWRTSRRTTAPPEALPRRRGQLAIGGAVPGRS